MKKIALAAAAALTAGTFALAAIAQDPGANDFTEIDGNNDGYVSFDEARAISIRLDEVLFNQADTNGDGQLDEAEFQGLLTLAASLGGDALNTDSSEDSSSSSSENSSSSSSSSEDTSSSSAM